MGIALRYLAMTIARRDIAIRYARRKYGDTRTMNYAHHQYDNTTKPQALKGRNIFGDGYNDCNHNDDDNFDDR